ncbi:fatty acid synthase CEM1 [Sugiyamaella lignohabitans]|uniref:3-oxoacyl-[acyl-carrier-protein] synthase n=1 Tax=Sugiyamaella lignohabitans TaxID=796027 RepID=A0A167FEZ7_9ASCO|nr:fatty acid synthase CEM1 [Sugiyamaella lignohabitans]ANB15214.1 fatty acid synthase CEM1 [Sugiyamaella lignohabitans]
MSALKRVVVTGLGTVNPLGVGVTTSWNKLVSGKSGIVALTEPEYQSLPSTVAGKVPINEWNPLDWIDSATVKRTSLFVQYALAAAKQALDDAQWPTQTGATGNMDRTGVAIGSSIGGLEALYDNAVNYNTAGYRKVSPLFIPNLLNNMASGHVSIKYGFKGPNHTVSTACTTGAHAIGDAGNLIRLGMADVMVAGSSEAVIHPLAIAGFARARSLATKYNDEPEKSSRPFDKARNGFVIAEGSAVVILEEYEHALRRNARIYGELIGYGMSGDANHITAPAENGDGAFRSMTMAIQNAGITPDQVDYINAHATSTPLGDAAENSAIKRLFVSHNRKASDINVSSTKGATGHLLGAAGSLEAIFTLLSIHTNKLPPTLNLSSYEPGFDCNYVANVSQEARVNVALTNSFGFGGTNASLLFRKL